MKEYSSTITSVRPLPLPNNFAVWPGCMQRRYGEHAGTLAGSRPQPQRSHSTSAAG
ncbi:MAG: hypothetical protein NWR99_07915 [Verrucomicrobiales bacterium]|nr:hypothetical protein [Verrucomicrobiales bacterium]